MGSASPPNCVPASLAEVWLRAGQVPLDRILMQPYPGTATVADAVESRERFQSSCELVHGILVAKTMGYYESKVALALAYFLLRYLEDHPLGEVAGMDGPCETLPNQIRKPDVAFTTFERLQQHPPQGNHLPCAPDLAVEVLSSGNTAAEMDAKLHEYFAAGARLVWYIEPEVPSARVFTAVDQCEEIRGDGVLRGGELLPGFSLSLKQLVQKAGPRERR
jgi:Uma2 family endonuclease